VRVINKFAIGVSSFRLDVRQNHQRHIPKSLVILNFFAVEDLKGVTILEMFEPFSWLDMLKKILLYVI